MRYYPVFLDIKGRPCVIIGAGVVAVRKAEGLLKAGAVVTVVGAVASRAMATFARAGRVNLIRRRYKPGDLKGAYLVVSATDSAAVNKAVYDEAVSLGIPVNCVDAPQYCTFIVPAVVDRDDLVIAVSTSGAAPALAARLRSEIEAVYGPEYAVFLEILGAVRRKLLKSRMRRDKKERVIRQLAASEIPAFIRGNDCVGIDAILRSSVGAGYTLAALGVRLKAKGRRPVK
ncbi:MAG: bifunctional precorrin-2 dehydrogenase/sirohydrochlorin ferrochelatase [Deltaproteobacteria bacterium]|nr:bifunctional precorrin-2 dehydrogenase/sirohydrochlorin ferrochelatase [Deltaproteobacteria bacterium]